MSVRFQSLFSSELRSHWITSAARRWAHGALSTLPVWSSSLERWGRGPTLCSWWTWSQVNPDTIMWTCAERVKTLCVFLDWFNMCPNCFSLFGPASQRDELSTWGSGPTLPPSDTRGTRTPAPQTDCALGCKRFGFFFLSDNMTHTCCSCMISNNFWMSQPCNVKSVFQQQKLYKVDRFYFFLVILFRLHRPHCSSSLNVLL